MNTRDLTKIEKELVYQFNEMSKMTKHINLSSYLHDGSDMEAFETFKDNLKGRYFKFASDRFIGSAERTFSDGDQSFHASAMISFDLDPSEWSDEVRRSKAMAEKSYLTDEQQDTLGLLQNLMSSGISIEQAKDVFKMLKSNYIIRKRVD